MPPDGSRRRLPLAGTAAGLLALLGLISVAAPLKAQLSEQEQRDLEAAGALCNRDIALLWEGQPSALAKEWGWTEEILARYVAALSDPKIVPPERRRALRMIFFQLVKGWPASTSPPNRSRSGTYKELKTSKVLIPRTEPQVEAQCIFRSYDEAPWLLHEIRLTGQGATAAEIDIHVNMPAGDDRN